MKLNPRWGRLARAVNRWWRNEQEPPVDRSFLAHAQKLLDDYHEGYANRVGTMNTYARQAAMIIEQEGKKRAPTLESEVRILALAMNQLLSHIDYIESRRKSLEDK